MVQNALLIGLKYFYYSLEATGLFFVLSCWWIFQISINTHKSKYTLKALSRSWNKSFKSSEYSGFVWIKTVCVRLEPCRECKIGLFLIWCRERREWQYSKRNKFRGQWNTSALLRYTSKILVGAGIGIIEGTKATVYIMHRTVRKIITIEVN